MTGPQCPQQTRLAEYATGKLPEPEASSIAQHLEQCGDCEATIQRLEAASDTFVAGLKAEAPATEPYTDEAPYRRAAEQAAQLSAATSPPSPRAGEGPGVRGAAAEGASPPAASPAPSSGLRPPSPVAGAAAQPAPSSPPSPLAGEGPGVRGPAPVEKSVTKGTSKLGPYQLLAKLGEGGMGAVYKARHEHLEKIVAIKILPKKAMQDAAAVARFRREMKVVGALHHPNIVGAHDAGEALGVHYLVMEYVAGSDLSSLLKKQGPLPLDRAISYTRQAARGLAFAHAKGVIHRDIKPANLLVDGEGTLKILDLGLARLDDGDLHNAAAREGLTQTGQVMGTVDYMAPEQAFDTHRADAKADVYSLGCSLYRLLTGQNVFGGDTVVQKILAHREQPIPSLRVARPDVPPRLDALYQRMIAKRPEDRPTMAEIAGELEALERGVAEAPAESIVIDTSKAASPERKRRDASRAAGPGRPAPTAPSPARGPRASAPRGPGRRPPVWLLAAAAGGAALVVCLGVWIIVRDPQGNEIARVQAPDGSSVTVQPAPPSPLVGEGSGVRGGAPLAGTGPAATGAALPPPPAWNPATIDFAAHRAEAEWLLSAGADYVMIAPPHDLTAETSVKQLADLPQQPFVLTVITLYNAKRRPDEARYRAWAKLTSLRGLSYLSGPTLTDRAVAELAGLPRLDHFGFVSQTNVTNEGLRAIARSKTLRRLDLHSSPQFDDASLAILTPLTELTSLDLRGWRLGAPGLRDLTRFEKLEVLLIEPRLSTGLGQLKALTRLRTLELEGSFVTDAALQELAGVTILKKLVLTRTRVTPAGVAEFRKAGGAWWVDLRTSAGEPDLPPPAPLAGEGPAATGAALTPYEILTSPDYEWSPPENLGPAVNTSFAERYPALSADGLRLVYHGFFRDGSSLCETTRASVAERFGAGVPFDLAFDGKLSAAGVAISGDGLTLVCHAPRPGQSADVDLWQASRLTVGSAFSKPVSLTVLNSPQWDGDPALSHDGLTVWFKSDRPGGPRDQYWTSRRASLAAEFEPPAPFPLPLVSGATRHDHVSGITLSADERVLVFAAKVNGVVDANLFVSVRPTREASFGAPVSLGPAINSEAEDVHPRLSADGTMLVFASRRPGGVGDYDLWMTRRVRKAKSSTEAASSIGDYALDFDGVDDLVRIQNYQYVAPSPLTFEAVVAARPPRSQVDALIFAAGSGSNGPRLVCSSRSWSFIYPASPANGSVYAGSDSPVEFGSAVHLAGVWDGREVRLYVDGKRQRQTATPTLRPLDPASVVLGRIGGGGIHGRLQEIRISKVVRYTTDFVPVHRFDADDDTEVLYHFDEGAGDVLHDASGNGHDGRIVGATWVRADGSPINPPSPLAGEGLGVRGPAAAGPPATGPALAPSTPPPVTLPGVDPVRQAVEYLLSRQVRIDALVAGRRINLKPGDAVPPGPIEVSGVHLNGQASYNRDDFAWLPRLPGLQALFVNSTSFDDACLAYLDGQTKIVTVWVDQTRLTPAGHAELVRKLPALKSINLGGPGCTDETLAALHAAAQLKYLEFMSPSAITPAGYLALRRALPGCTIKPHVPSMPPADFPTGPLPAASPASPPAAATGPAGTAPKQLAYLDPAFQAWVEATRKLPAEQQLEEVSKKLMELNPGFDGQLLAADLAAAPKINNHTVISLGLVSDAVTDLSPLRALKGLVYFACHGTKFGGGQFADLSPLEDLPLESFITQDTRIADLSPLATCKSLRLVKLSSTHATAEQVDRLRAALPKCDVKWDGRTDAPAVERRIAEWALERRWGLQILIDRVPQVITDRGQLPPEPFWVNSLSMHVSAQDADLARLAPCIGLTHVSVVDAPISDAGLAHLKDAKILARLSLAGTRVTDAGLAHLAGLSKLVDLDLRRTRVTPAGVAALQKALRGCKILWDGSAER